MQYNTLMLLINTANTHSELIIANTYLLEYVLENKDKNCNHLHNLYYSYELRKKYLKLV